MQKSNFSKAFKVAREKGFKKLMQITCNKLGQKLIRLSGSKSEYIEKNSGGFKFYANIRNIVSDYGFEYDNWHPFEAQLRQYESKPKINYENSILKKFYEHFTYSKANQIIYGENTNMRNIKLWPVQLWKLKFDELRNHKTNNRWFGSNYILEDHAEEYISKKFHHLISLHESIKSEGYQPQKFNAPHIRAIILKNNYNFKFLIMGGQHRIASLKVLGYKNIIIKLCSNLHPPIIDISKVDEQPLVQEGIYNEKTLKNLLYYYFYHDKDNQTAVSAYFIDHFNEKGPKCNNE